MTDNEKINSLIASSNLGGNNKFVNTSFRENINLIGLTIQKRFVFEKCTFYGSVQFTELSLQDEINFIDCRFNGGLDFEKLNKSEVQNKGTLNVFSGEINHFSLRNSKVDSLSIKNVSKDISQISLSNSSINKIYFYAIDYLKTLNIESLSAKKFDFIRIKLAKDIIEKEIAIEELSFNTSVFECPIMLKDSFCIKKFEIFECDFNDYTSMDAPLFKNSLDGVLNISHSRFKKDFFYYYHGIDDQNFVGHKNLILDHNIINGTLEIISYQKLDLKITDKIVHQNDKPILNEFRLNCNSKNEGGLKISKINFVSLLINGTNSKSYLQFESVNAKDFKFSNFINFGNVSLINCFNTHFMLKEKRNLVIESSLINNLTLLNANLDSFTNVNIKESSLINLKANNTKFFPYEKLFEGTFIEREKYMTRCFQGICFLFFNLKENKKIDLLKNKREVYKQLKLSAEQNGDRIQSLEFKSNEMKAYLNVLVLTKSIWNQERLILALSSINDFGLNWKKALKWCILSMLIIYFVLLIQIHPNLYFHFNITSIKYTIDLFLKNFSIYFQILNPIHDINKVISSPLKLSNTTYFIDYFSRVAMSFFIFQIVSAFRKYTK